MVPVPCQPLHRLPRSAAPRRLGRGMTLVELMVGLALGLFLVSVMGTVYVGSKNTYLAQEGGARMQENGRFAMDLLAQDLRMSGFRGCQTGGTVVNTLNSPQAVLHDYGQPVWGSRHTGGAWSPALTAPLNGLSLQPAGDVLVVRRPWGTGWSLIGAMDDSTAALSVSATPTIAQGDLLMVADCGGASVLQATNANPGTSGSIAHDSTVTGLSPGVSQDGLGRVYANDAQVWRLQSRVYHLAESARHPGERALWVYRHPTYGEAQLTELITGVEAMALRYGLDTDGDQAADRFARADQVANWQQVVSAKVELLFVDRRETGTTQPQPYTFDGATTTPTDHRARSVLALVVSLRNRVP